MSKGFTVIANRNRITGQPDLNYLDTTSNYFSRFVDNITLKKCINYQCAEFSGKRHKDPEISEIIYQQSGIELSGVGDWEGSY